MKITVILLFSCALAGCASPTVQTAAPMPARNEFKDSARRAFALMNSSLTGSSITRHDIDIALAEAKAAAEGTDEYATAVDLDVMFTLIQHETRTKESVDGVYACRNELGVRLGIEGIKGDSSPTGSCGREISKASLK